jgi:hypothetical protein
MDEHDAHVTWLAPVTMATDFDIWFLLDSEG